jgi:hypothetical protein
MRLPCERDPGIAGVPIAYYVLIEEAHRRSLHAHARLSPKMKKNRIIHNVFHFQLTLHPYPPHTITITSTNDIEGVVNEYFLV